MLPDARGVERHESRKLPKLLKTVSARSINDTKAVYSNVVLVPSHSQSLKSQYIPRGKNQLHRIFERNFSAFCDEYEDRYARRYGPFQLDRIQSVGERFFTCGDYLQGIARIRCTNPECGHDYFRRGRPVRLAAMDRLAFYALGGSV